MREDRLVALRMLGADGARRAAALPIIDRRRRRAVDVSERGGGSAGGDVAATQPPSRVARTRETERAERVRLAGHIGAGLPYSTYRIRFAKVGRAAFLGHLDLVRLLARSFRRADLPLAMTRGFSPKPRITFGPALGLGIPSLGELMDVDLEHAPCRHAAVGGAERDVPRVELSPTRCASGSRRCARRGSRSRRCAIVRLAGHQLATQPDTRPRQADRRGRRRDPARRRRHGVRRGAARADRRGVPRRRPSATVERGDKTIDVRALVIDVDVIDGEAAPSSPPRSTGPPVPCSARGSVRPPRAPRSRPRSRARSGCGAATIRAQITRWSPGSASWRLRIPAAACCIPRVTFPA